MEIKSITREWVTLSDGTSGSRMLDECGNRRVYNIDNKFVLKLDNPASYYNKQNEQELKNYEVIPEFDSQFFAKLISHGYLDGHLYLIQEFVQESFRAKTDDDTDNYELLRSKYNLRDIFLGGRNCFLTEDSFKIIDLGYMPLTKEARLDNLPFWQEQDLNAYGTLNPSFL
jgi:hypothetical protein